MSPAEREALRARRGIALDANKRIDEIEQTARGLISETDLRHSRFPADARALLARLAQANGVLAQAASDPGAELLCSLGIAYRTEGARGAKAGPRTSGASRTGKRIASGALVLPGAFLVQVPLSEGEDPRGLRACLGLVEHDVLHGMVTTVLGRPLAGHTPLMLQEVWEVLSQAGELASRVSALAGTEARLLDNIERAGGEVTTAELLALDQTPGIVRSGSTVAVPKRGAPFMLQRRGMLFPLGADRFVIPTEVARVVGASRQAERAARRAQTLASLREEDFAPRRARYARDPSLGALAAMAMLRAWETPVRDDAGIPRTAVRRIAERLGERDDTVALWLALARAAGLARLLVPEAGVPGSLAALTGAELGGLLRTAWRRGGAWDESRADPEVARVSLVERASTAAPVLRALCLDALEELARDRWVPVDAVVRFALDDPRAQGAGRIHARAQRERPDGFRASVEESLRVMVTASLPAIGVVDIAEDGSSVRLMGREHAAPTSGVSATPVQRTHIELSVAAPLHALLAFCDVAEPEGVRPEQGVLVCALGAAAVARGRARGVAPEVFASLAQSVGVREPRPASVREVLDGLSNARVLPFVAASGAVYAETPELRAQLLADAVLRRQLIEVDAGPWLLVRAEADRARVEARLTRMGVRLTEVIDPRTLRANEGTAQDPRGVWIERREGAPEESADESADERSSAG